MQDLISSQDIIILSEIWNGSDYNPYNSLYKYTQVTRSQKHPNAKRHSGGIGILISKYIEKGVKIENKCDFLVWIRLDSKFFSLERDVVVGAIYIPPEGSSYIAENDNYFNIISEQLGAIELQNVDLVLCGNLNARTASVHDLCGETYDSCKDVLHEHRISKDLVLNNNGEELIQLYVKIQKC